MSDYSLRQVLRYKFDNFMSRGGTSIFLFLVVVFLCVLLTVSLIRGGVLWGVPAGKEWTDIETGEKYQTSENKGFFRNMYVTFLQMTDAGNMGADLQSHPGYKAVAIIAGVCGLVFFSALIATLTSALDQKLSELKKGHSKVIEDDHTLMLGWNERVPEVLRELIIANESEKNACVVILANRDKEEMDDELKLRLPNTKTTRIVTRSGNGSSLVNLETVSLDRCKSVIVLATCSVSGSADEKATSDTIVTKTILAVMACRPEGKKMNVVAEVFDSRHREIVEGMAPGEICTVDTNEILAKILVQTSRSTGLSVVYSEMLSFEGAEMYFHGADWGGRKFGEIAFHFPDGVPLGVRHSDGSLALNPPIKTPMQSGDEVLILAQDDSSIEFQPQPVAAPGAFRLAGGRQEQGIERELIIGWTDKVETILREYADYVLEGSAIDVMLRAPDEEVRSEIERIGSELPTVELSLVDGDPLSLAGLQAVEPWKYDNIIILSQGNEGGNDERTDSETIIILLLLRRLFRDRPAEAAGTKLITEVLDSENQPLVARTGVNDFIISNRVVSMMLAQISEQADIKRVYDDLFSEEGSEIYLKPASLYFESFPAKVSFADMMGVAQQRGEVCLGVKLKALEQELGYNFGVTLIPEKTSQYSLGPED
jgi:hypothetical protein